MVAADECGLTLTREQADYLADAASGSHENYGLAFYRPSASDRLADIDRGWKAKYDALRADFDHYRSNAEQAVRIALNQRHNANISIGEHGEVRLYDGRSDRIQ
jgi:hypothetical protein